MLKENFNLLSKFIKPGDFILAHDYGESKEIFDTKWKDYNYQPLIRIPDEEEDNFSEYIELNLNEKTSVIIFK